MKKYDHKKIEKKWQAYWQAKEVFAPKDGDKRPKKYILDMFPYPSGAGLHVGHPEGYTATDILSRYSRMKGFNVLHPMGWDAFGLPAENYAIKMGIHPQKTTQKNIKRFTEQIKMIGLSYDWSREVNTSDPNYYKWTQWLFLQLYKHGLAYKKEASVNWCPKDNTVLANEQVINGACERCGTQVIQKNLSQWFLKITDYAEELLADLDKLDWPEPIKLMQRNWIGKSQGAEIEFKLVIPASEPESSSGSRLASDLAGMTQGTVKVFTTRPDTLFGATYLVLAPEHELISSALADQISNWEQVQEYREATKKKSELQRTQLEKEKTGVELKGVTAINPATNQHVPVWIADYVITGYGTGAIMAVPAHDERDFEFAKKFDLPVVSVVAPFMGPGEEPDKSSNYTGPGNLINSGEYNGLDSKEAIAKIGSKYGKLTTKYKLRDWLVSRQRYWGAPIPIIYCQKCGEQPVPEKDLPVMLPTDADFRPTGESPLKRSKKFKKVICPKCKGKAERDYDTMDTFVDSSWYFLRYTDPKNKSKFADAKKIKQWMPVDTYVGGAEHAVLHLLYSRFFTKALRDFKLLNFDEPFLKLRNQGLILGPDGEKMSKSRGNVVNPDDVVKEFGADSLRMYEMFMGPLEDAKPWQTNGIVGVRRFLDRVWGWVSQSVGVHAIHSGGKAADSRPYAKDSEKTERLLNKLIKKVTEDIETFHYNTAISSFMEFYNEIKDEPVSKQSIQTFLLLLYPFAPHITEELNQLLGGKKALQLAVWPKYDESKLAESTAEIIVQVNGKVKGKCSVVFNATESSVKALALGLDAVAKTIGSESIKRVVFVPNRLINFVV